MNKPQSQPPDLANQPPAYLRKLVLRLATLAPGMAYTLTLSMLGKEQEPIFTVTPLGKVEGSCNSEK